MKSRKPIFLESVEGNVTDGGRIKVIIQQTNFRMELGILTSAENAAVVIQSAQAVGSC